MAASLRQWWVQATLVLGTLLCTMHLAHADMWTFVDERGVKHFASSQLDKRYKLMFRAMAAPDVDVASGSGTVTAVARTIGAGASGRSVASLVLSPWCGPRPMPTSWTWHCCRPLSQRSPGLWRQRCPPRALSV